MSTRRELQTTRHDRGSTLIEILIAISILGVLATVAVFGVRGVADEGEHAPCREDRSTMVTSAEHFMAENSVDAIPTWGTGTDRYE
jgi:prepilin-type N-terminal cleavage/methylation domain-containing protein